VGLAKESFRRRARPQHTTSWRNIDGTTYNFAKQLESLRIIMSARISPTNDYPMRPENNVSKIRTSTKAVARDLNWIGHIVVSPHEFLESRNAPGVMKTSHSKVGG
jgi:hypothetical protein